MIDPIYNINAFLNDRGGLGLLLKSLFGYNGNPALIESVAYVGYFVVIWWALRMQRRIVLESQPA